MHQLDDCIFCQIAQGHSPCYKIHEDDLTLIFLDVFPASAGHLLIITKEHFDDIFSIPPEVIARVATHSVKMAALLNRVLKPDGLGVHQLNKAAAGQTVFHYHMHLIPQWEGQQAGIHSKAAGDPEQLKLLADRLAAAL